MFMDDAAVNQFVQIVVGNLQPWKLFSIVLNLVTTFKCTHSL